MRRMLAVAGVMVMLLASACDRAPTEAEWLGPGPDGATWGTWVLAGPAELRPPRPAYDRAAEREQVLDLQRRRTDADDAAIARWTGPATGPWTELAMDLVDRYIAFLPRNRVATPARASRAAALLHVAMYDATVAAWDAKYTYERAAPHRDDPRIEKLAPDADVPGFPSEHAAASAAAAAVLAYAFPDEDPARFEAMAKEAGRSRILAGAAYPSDVEAGMHLGREVAARVLARAASDGADLPWDPAYPETEWVWQPTPPRMTEPPYDPRAGEWRPWTLDRNDQFRPPPPPAIGSPEFEADLDELRRMPESVTAAQVDAALYWATSAPSMRWHLYLEDELKERHAGALHAARAHALASVAIYDAYLACWEAKYHYWLLRPISASPEVETVFPTPPFPAYPSGHSTVSAAAAVVLAHLFPDAASEFRNRAKIAAESRVWGGVHYRFDSDAGTAQGIAVGQHVVDQGRRMVGAGE
jgi:membrane-associated phospholipid phosphatase